LPVTQELATIHGERERKEVPNAADEKGIRSVALVWPLRGSQARFATGFCSSSDMEEAGEVL
jgi:hypothetical protein